MVPVADTSWNSDPISILSVVKSTTTSGLLAMT